MLNSPRFSSVCICIGGSLEGLKSLRKVGQVSPPSLLSCPEDVYADALTNPEGLFYRWYRRRDCLRGWGIGAARTDKRSLGDSSSLQLLHVPQAPCFCCCRRRCRCGAIEMLMRDLAEVDDDCMALCHLAVPPPPPPSQSEPFLYSSSRKNARRWPNIKPAMGQRLALVGPHWLIVQLLYIIIIYHILPTILIGDTKRR